MFIEPYLGNITVFAGNFAPRSWMFCQGQLLPISNYDTLFALIGTTYGGDGQTTFGLPDFRGRAAVHAGQGVGLSAFTLGEVGGNENITLISTNLPTHSHQVNSFNLSQTASTETASGLDNPQNAYPASGTAVYANSQDGSFMGTYSSTSSSPIAGVSQPLSIVQPYLAMNYIIAVEGIFPSRN